MNALGKGLNALIPEGVEKGDSVIMVNIDRIKPSPHQMRTHFAEEKMKELADSIKEKGLIQPVVLERRGEGYELIAGERRWRAAKLAGVKEIPAVMRNGLKEGDKAEISLLENLQREDLNAMEIARGYKRLMKEFDFTQEDLAKRLGKSRSSIANFLRLMNYPEEIRKAVEKNEISEGHARAIMGIEDEKIRLAIFRRILREHLSVHEVEEIAKAGKKEKGGRAQVHKKKDIFIQDIENKIRRKLGTKIEVVNKKKGKNITGRIIIHYFSEEELNRILALLK